MSQCESLYDATLQHDLERIAALPLPWEELNNATILITGATGLIGSLLVRTLLAANRIYQSHIRILALARSQTKALKVFDNLLQRSELELLYFDITNPVIINDNVDYIVHTAAITASKELVTHPVDAISVTVTGTKNILDLAREKKCRSVVYLSSMEVYGTLPTSDGHRITEKELGYIDPLNVRSCYPESKRLCENMCISYFSQYGIPVKIARLAQTFGAGVSLSDHRVFAEFAKAVLDKKDIILHTKGTSYGNYCYSADAISGIITILLSGKNAEAYNVVSECTTTTIGQMAQLVSEQISKGSSKVVFDIPSDAQAYGYAPDVELRLSGEKLQALGWKPSIAPNLEEMFQRLIASYKSQIAESNQYN